MKARYLLLIILHLFSWNSILQGQPFEYQVLIQADTKIDSFIIKKNPGTDSLYYSYRGDHKHYEFRTEDRDRTWLNLICKDCSKGPVAHIYGSWENEDVRVSAQQLQILSIAECFKKLRNPRTWYQRLGIDINTVFWKDISITDIIPGLRGEKPKSADPKLYFQKPETEIGRIEWYYISPSDLAIPFEYNLNYPIDGLYIFDVENKELIFHAGNADILGIIAGDIQGTSPAVETVLELVKQEEDNLSMELRGNKLRPYLYRPFELGKKYQLGISLKGDPAFHNPYLFNFYFLSLEELHKLEEARTRE